MSLVDYASSSEEDIEEGQHDVPRLQTHGSTSQPSIYLPSPNQNQISALQGQRSEATSSSADVSMTKLPDASELLVSVAVPFNEMGTDHSSRVAAAMAASASRKRPESNGSVILLPHRKLPRGNLPHSRIPPDTSGGLLIPPQLTGSRRTVDCAWANDCLCLGEQLSAFGRMTHQTSERLVVKMSFTHNNERLAKNNQWSNVATEDVEKLFVRRKRPEDQNDAPSVISR